MGGCLRVPQRGSCWGQRVVPQHPTLGEARARAHAVHSAALTRCPHPARSGARWRGAATLAALPPWCWRSRW